MTEKLDKNSHHEWEKCTPGADIPTVDSFLTFLQTRCHILEATHKKIDAQPQPTNTNSSNKNRNSFNKSTSQRQQHAYVGTQGSVPCPACQQPHAIYMCEAFLRATSHERLDMARKADLCTNCLKKGHSPSLCRGRACKICLKKHNTLLHQKHMSLEGQACEEHFVNHTTRDPTGRFIVKIPFNEKKHDLGESFNVAERRLYSLEKKLSRDPQLKQQCSLFMHEYTQLGHMTELHDADIHQGYYLPHHAVLKNDSVTTKLRVAFDGSARTSTGLSLNECQFNGPTIQDDVYTLILRFRFYEYVLTADIEKMYRQVLVHDLDRIYQKILWREGAHSPIKTYALNTVTYGTSSAPFLAVRVLKKLAEDDGTKYPLAAKALERDVYVDNFLTGANTLEEASELRDELIQLTKRGGFKLRQWSSNEKSLVNVLDSDQSSNSHLLLDTASAVKTLGILWNAEQDKITYQIKLNKDTNCITKRTILSQIASLFDPLGLLGRIIVAAKITMQKIWRLKIDWDESVPSEIHQTWYNFKKDLIHLNAFKIPRKIHVNNATTFQLHGFCDASEAAYGACLYIYIQKIRTINAMSIYCAQNHALLH